MPILLDGKAVAQAIRQELAQQVKVHKNKGSRAPHLAITLIGRDPASHTYVNNKIKACQEVGFQSTLIQKEYIEEEALLQLIQQINENEAIDGLIVQLPLPQHINVQKVINHIKPTKDVDGLHALNYGKMARNLPAPIPATPLGILTLLERYQVSTRGQHCVIVGRGTTVGAPLGMLMSRDSYPGNATVTLCHSYTKALSTLTRQADILIAAVGKPKMITASMVRTGAVVIDVGITRVPDPSRQLGYKLQGDVDFEQVAPRCSYITPVPGGVGPMTVAALLLSTLHLCKETQDPSKAGVI